MSTLYSVGQMNQLGDALEKAGFTPKDVTELRSFAGLGEFKAVLKGQARIVKIKHLIDLDADPFVPDNSWHVEEHIKGGKFKFDPKKVVLCLYEEQQNGGVINGNKLRKKLKGKSVFNANLLDFLWAHPNLIPEEWKGKVVYFWGTIYRPSDDRLYVRGLIWYNDEWRWRCLWLDKDFDDNSPAAVLA